MMCKHKECPECHMLIPAHATVCTHNGCHHVFDECIPHVATIVHAYVETKENLADRDDSDVEAHLLQHFYIN